MTTHRTPAAAGPSLVPPVLAAWLSIFRDCFTAPVWKHVLVLVAGRCSPGKRTVSEVLWVMGRNTGLRPLNALRDLGAFGRIELLPALTRPSARAYASPALVRSGVIARSNSAKLPTICIIMRPAGRRRIDCLSQRAEAVTCGLDPLHTLRFRLTAECLNKP